MCGIAGVVSFDAEMPVTRDHLARMSAEIAHRGPDGERLWITPDFPRAGIAFRRLAVIDPEERAMQPMHSPDGRFTLAFNGEIYNYRKIRALLSPRDWQTEGDAEVLLAALATWGPQGLEHLSGMFAFALWDNVEKSLLLARDRMGQKPLYLSIGRSSIAFASELCALNAWPDWEQEIDPDSLVDYLRFGSPVPPRTLFVGCHQVLPGHYIKITTIEETLTQTRYFDPNPTPRADPSTDFRAMIERAVEEQLVSDVPLGVFLSGGIDSSIIARCARKHGRVKTFSIGFDDPRYDETPFAREVAKHLDTDHHEFRVTPDAAVDLPNLARVYGDPFADSSALPTHYLSRETRKHVTVALSGDGGDELFAGYDRHRAIGMSIRALRPLAPIGRLLSRGHPKSKLTRVGRLIESAGLSEAARYLRYVSIFPDDTIRALLKRDRLSPAYERLWSDLRASRDATQTALAIDRVTYLPNDLLMKVDRASMLHALEVRSPFMDHDLVDAAAQLSTKQLLRRGKKSVLREVFAADLPASVFDRPKMGFAVPIGDWFRGALRPMLLDHLRASDSFAKQHFDTNVVDRLTDEHLSMRADHSQRLFALLMLEIWHRSRLS